MEAATAISDIRKRLAVIERKLVKRPTVWDKRNAALRESAEQVWTYLFNEPMPDNVKVKWVPYLRGIKGQATVGAMYHGGVIELDWSYLSRPENNALSVLVHEFAHSRGFAGHGKRFRMHVDKWLEQLGLPKE